MSFERPITKSMRAKAEAERKARLEAEYALAIQKQQEEQRVRLEKARAEWESLLKALPQELSRLEEVVHSTISEWEQRASATINWNEVEDPACSTEWELRFNSHERFEESIYCQYESSDSRRGGYDTERIVRERMPGSYWVNPHSNKEHFISRASTPDGPVPPVQYPYCTIAGELNLWKEYPHDKARVDAIIQKLMQDREYYKSRIKEARTALAGNTREKTRYLLSRCEGDKVRNELRKTWAILNPGKSETKFWDDILQSL